jgi:hypothetical protein
MLREKQEAIVKLLERNAALSDLTIIAENRLDLVTAINTSMAKLGLCVIVQTLEAAVLHPAKPGPVFDAQKFSVVVHEQPTLNRGKTDRTAQSVAEQVAVALHHQRIENDTLMCLGIFYQQDSNFLTYAVDFKTGE